MPATPAWPPRKPAAPVRRSGAGARLSVDRRRQLSRHGPSPGPGDQVKLFDDRTGEWLAEIAEAAARSASLLASATRLRERETVPDLWLLFAPIKRGRIDWLVEKATELGVARLVPVDHPAHNRRPAQPRSPARPRRSKPPSNASAPRFPSLPNRASSTRCCGLARGRILYFADEGGGEPFAAAPPARPRS